MGSRMPSSTTPRAVRHPLWTVLPHRSYPVVAGGGWGAQPRLRVSPGLTLVSPLHEVTHPWAAVRVQDSVIKWLFLCSCFFALCVGPLKGSPPVLYGPHTPSNGQLVVGLYLFWCQNQLES